ncbi:exocyst complex component 7 isoform X2 [Leptidea sinapis]|uniref:exocyst complex component 7 isoform X2 n=1 Tax=Leptidea sinapis TaxID=189913 RepID=UPI0021C413C8|nr:exocyst complex component 7 isoform X2 [Leptidea sinapis]
MVLSEFMPGKMYAVEKKLEIEMKLKKEMTNIEELKAATKRSSAIANDVCNVLGACEQRLQQLESAVLPLYGDTARLQHIHQNMEKTVKALDHVINYYMVSRELADLIQAGPHTTTSDALNIYLEALDKLAEAQNYFNKNNPQSVELENINQLYNSGVLKLETAFEELLSRNTRPLSPTTLMDMIAIEEDSSADSVSVGGSQPAGGAADAMRAAAAWLSAAGRPPAAPLVAVRAPAALASLNNFRHYLRSRSMAASPLRGKKNLNRTDSTTRRTSKIQKVIEKRAINIMMKASQTLEQSTGLAIGPRRSLSEPYMEEFSEAVEEHEADAAGTLAVALCRVVRCEQRHALGLVPLPRLPALLTAITSQCIKLLATEVEKACARSRRGAARCSAGAAACWGLLARLQRLAADVARALHPASAAPYAALVASAQQLCVRSLEEWVEGVRGEGAEGSVDGTVHQLTVAALAYCQGLASHMRHLGPALAAEASYSRAASQVPAAQDRDALMFSLYMRKVLAQLNLALRSKSEQYPDALKAIFLLNNTLYLLQGLQRSGLIEVLKVSEPGCEGHYRDMIHSHKTAYLQSWSKLLSYLVLEEPLPAKLRDKDRQMLKDKFSSFNREWEDTTRAQRGYAVPEREVRESLKREVAAALLPAYSALHARATAAPFAKNPDKYVKYTPVQIAAQLDGYFDEAA